MVKYIPNIHFQNVIKKLFFFHVFISLFVIFIALSSYIELETSKKNMFLIAFKSELITFWDAICFHTRLHFETHNRRSMRVGGRQL